MEITRLLSEPDRGFFYKKTHRYLLNYEAAYSALKMTSFSTNDQ